VKACPVDAVKVLYGSTAMSFEHNNNDIEAHMGRQFPMPTTIFV